MCPKKRVSDDMMNDGNEDGSRMKENGSNKGEEVGEQWKVVQKTRRQRKNRDKQRESARPARMGLRFNALAPTDDGNYEVTRHNQEIRAETVFWDPVSKVHKQQSTDVRRVARGSRGGNANIPVSGAEGTVLVEETT